MSGISSPPLVSVVMAVYNGETHLSAAIHSVLKQTLTDFEFIVVDDGSQDRSREIVAACPDPRIRLLCNEKNLGLAASLNYGIANARGTFVARMDHDDISLPRRLERQVAMLLGNPQLAACGTWIETFGGPRRQIWRAPTNPEGVRMQLLFDSALLHPTVMLRRDLFQQLGLLYDGAFTCAQDYELWERASHVVAMANVGEALVRYRLHPGQTGKVRQQTQRDCADLVRRRALQTIGLAPGEAELALHSAIARGEITPSSVFLQQVAEWLLRIREANQRCGHYDPVSLDEFLGRMWWSACLAVSPMGLEAYRCFTRQSLHILANLTTRQRVNLWGRCWLANLGLSGNKGSGAWRKGSA